MRTIVAALVLSLVGATVVVGLAPEPVGASTAPTIISQPVPTSGYSSSVGELRITVGSTGGTPSGVWQHSDDGVEWTTVGTASLTLTGSNRWQSQRVIVFTPAPRRYHRAIITNAFGQVTSDVVEVTVLADAAPTISASPASVARYPGTTTLTASADVPATDLQIRWEHSPDATVWTTVGSSSGTTVLAATPRIRTSSYSFALGPSTVGWYRATFTNALGSATTDPALVELIPGSTAVVVEPPQDVAVATASQDLQLSVRFSGTVTSVRWTHVPSAGGTATTARTASISGTDVDVLSVPRTQAFDRRYTVELIGPYGNATASARVTVGQPTSISVQPVDRVAVLGGSTTFVAAVAGTPTINRWERSDDGGTTWAPVGTASTTVGSKSLTLSSIQATDDGARFRLVTENGFGRSESVAASLALVPAIDPPVLTSAPTGVFVYGPGSTVVEAAATGYNVDYSWQRWEPCPFTPTPTNPLVCLGWDGWRTLGAGVGPSIDLTAVTALAVCGTTRARVRATNEAGSATREFEIHKASAAPTVQSQPPATSFFLPGTPMQPSPGVGTCSAVARWEREGPAGGWTTAVEGSALLTLTAADDGARFRQVFRNGLGEVATDPVTLRAVPSTAFGQQPVDAVVAAGQVATFSAGTAVAGWSYQWQTRAPGASNWVNVSGSGPTGATTPTLGYPVGSADDGRAFRLRATHPHRSGTGSSSTSVTSDPATLRLAVAPAIVVGPLDVVVRSGATATFSVEVAGMAAPSIRWEWSSDGTTWSPLPGASATLELGRVTVGMSGRAYRAIATNQSGAATSAPATLTVLVPQSLSFPALPASPPSGAVHVLGAVLSSGRSVSYEATGACALDGDVVTFTTPGQVCRVTARDDGGGSHAPVEVVRSARVARSAQAITFDPLPDGALVGTTTTLAASSTSGLVVSYLASGGCRVSGRTLTWTDATLRCDVTARQNGSSTVAPAVPVTRSATAAMGEQTISVRSLPSRLLVGQQVTVVARATSGLPVSLRTEGACELAGAVLTVTAPGPCSLIADQAGSPSWHPAPTVTIGRVVRLAQEITFPPLPPSPSVGSSATLAATADSGLVVTYVASGGCTIRRDVVTFTAAGPCTVTARQFGTSLYLPAPPVSRTVDVDP